MIGRLEGLLKERKIHYRKNVSAATLCTFRIGGMALLVAEPTCIGELIETVCLCKAFGCPFAVIGKGSNLLFSDREIKTVLIRTTALRAVQWHGDRMVAQCGVMLPRLAALAARVGYADLAFLCGIPGTLGGGILMNAGAHGKNLGDLLESVTYFDPAENKIKTIDHKKLNTSYRNSVFQQNYGIILTATLKLRQTAPAEEVFSKMSSLLAARTASQPLEYPNAGSAFRRFREDLPIGRVIDELGMKGLRHGGAAVSEKHAGFIVNLGNATAADVVALIGQVQNKMEGLRGVRPIPEYRFIPQDDELFTWCQT